MFDRLFRRRSKVASHTNAEIGSTTIAEQVHRWERTHPGSTLPELPQTGLLGRIHAVEEAAGGMDLGGGRIERPRR